MGSHPLCLWTAYDSIPGDMEENFVMKEVTIIELEGWKIFWHIRWEQDYYTQRDRKARGMFR